MKAIVFAFTRRGKATALRVRDALGDCEVELRAPEKQSDDAFDAYVGSLPEYTGTVFDRDALVFIGATGIAVRAIAPHVASKRSDPAVICVDERAQYVIPLLSGHIGGANRLARRLAEALGAMPVVTTATDVNGKFSVDTWATERGLAITSMALAKRVSAEILTQNIPIWSPKGYRGERLPDGLVWDDRGELGICVSVRDDKPFQDTLLLVPRALRVGIGCRRGTDEAAIEALIGKVFEENHLRTEAVAGAASIDVKRDEAGLNAFCRTRGWPISFYSAQRLNEVPGQFTGSAFVARTVGVDNVCERAALASGGALIVPKTAMDGVTVAVAEMEWGIEFG